MVEESLRDLVVSLSLKTENFTRNINSVTKQIRKAESTFKLMGAGIDSFESSTAGLSAKLDMLNRKMKLQKSVVDQYEKALARASNKITECYQRQTDYASRLDMAKQKQASLAQEVTRAKQAYDTGRAGHPGPGRRDCCHHQKDTARKGDENGMNDWFEWNQVKYTQYGVIVKEHPPITIAAERVIYVDIPSRAGSVTMTETDVYDDITLSPVCYLKDVSNLHKFVSWLKGKTGTLTFPARPNGFYYARLSNQIQFATILRGNPEREFTLTFRCKPFLYQKDCPEVTITRSGDVITNPGGVYSEPVITIWGSGHITFMVGETMLELENLSDYITLDTPLMEAHQGLSSLNDIMSGDFPVFVPGPNIISWIGNVTKVLIQPNWRDL